MNLQTINDENFNLEVLGATLPVLVEVWAPWCGPCNKLAPIIEEFTKSNQDMIKVTQLNSDDCPITRTKYNVKSVPTLLLFKDGILLDTKIGLVTLKRLNDWVDFNLGK